MTLHGTYELKDGTWYLELDPPTMIRAKRVFGRVRVNSRGRLMVKHTAEVARDLEWFMQRFPLTPTDPESGTALADAAEGHRVMQAKIHALTTEPGRQLTLPPDLLKTPRPYQTQAYDLLRLRHRYLLGDEVGLGKTLSALLIALEEDARPILVVPPTHLPRRWLSEIMESMPLLHAEVAKKTQPPSQILAGQLPDVMIVPYSKLAGWAPALAGRVQTVLFDEVQDLRRGTDSQKGAAAAHVAREAKYVLGITATPVYNYGGEVWNIFNIIAPDALGTRDEFTREWGYKMYNGHIFVQDPAALGAYLRDEGLLLARTRKDVGRELPAAVKVPHTVDADPEALDAVAGDAARLAELILSDTATGKERFTAAGDLDWQMRHATGIAKAPYVAEFVRMLLASEEKVALFGWHRAVWDVWREELAEFNPVMYTGTESAAQKAKAEEEFITGSSRVLMMSLRSGAGVDGLQRVCSVAVFGELDWSPQVHEQAIGRFRRDGMDEQSPVVAYFLTSDEGSDPAILETLQVKRNQSEPVVSADGKLLGNSKVDTDRTRRLAQSVLTRSRRVTA